MARRLRAISSKLGLGAIVSDLHKRWKYSLYDRNRALRDANRRLATVGAPDGWPLPPPYLAYKVSSSFDLDAYLKGGALGMACIERALASNHISFANCRAVLDWGCGCGRIVRHLAARTGGKIYGCDYNPQLVRWCDLMLDFGEFEVCGLEPPLPYPDEAFDLVYAISVLTHTPTAMQVPWLTELRRVLKPGGHALLSVHGVSHIARLSETDRRRFERGEHVVVEERYAGTNLCGTYHPAAYVRDVLGKVMTLVAEMPDAARDAQQDFLLFRNI